MRVIVLGSGTSMGVPTLGCECAVCRSTNPLNKRMRASVYIEANGTRLLVDCGPDFRSQALRAGVRDVDVVLLTHTHTDHIAGLDDLRPFNLLHQHSITIYGAANALEDIRTRFSYCFAPPQPGGGIPDFRLQSVAPGERFMAGSIEVEVIPVFHGANPILGFRFGDFAYLTDVSRVPESGVEQLKGVRYLITSALRHKPHPTHMSLGEAVELSQTIGPEQTWFTHMCHDLEHDETNAQLPPHIQLSYDGLEFDV